MIQFKRGSTDKWKKAPTLKSGQPGYDKDKNKLKIGDGKSKWEELPYLKGAIDLEFLFQPKGQTAKTDEDVFITYGKDAPNELTGGQIYLQEYDGAVEVDYVIEIGRDLKYYYRKWSSGFMECWGTGSIPSSIEKLFTDIIFRVETEDCFELKGFWK